MRLEAWLDSILFLKNKKPLSLMENEISVKNCNSNISIIEKARSNTFLYCKLTDFLD